MSPSRENWSERNTSLLVVIALCAPIGALAALIAKSALFGLGTWIALSVILVIQGLQMIPASPPHVGLLTRWGKRTLEVKKEGWRFFALYPFWEGFIPIPAKKVDHDFMPQEVRTSDLAALDIPVSLTWIPAWKIKEEKKGADGTTETGPDGKPIFTERETPEHLITYVDSGGDAVIREEPVSPKTEQTQIKGVLGNIVQERLRQWAMSAEEGPRNFREALNAREAATAIILEAILEEKPLLGTDRDRKRREMLADMSRGDGHLIMKSLGVVIQRLNVGEIKLKGKAAEAADLEVKERLEWAAEKLERENLEEQTRGLAKNLGISMADAAEMIQTERGKIKKEVQEKKISLAPDTRELIRGVTTEILTLLRKGQTPPSSAAPPAASGPATPTEPDVPKSNTAGGAAS